MPPHLEVEYAKGRLRGFELVYRYTRWGEFLMFLFNKSNGDLLTRDLSGQYRPSTDNELELVDRIEEITST